MASVGYFIVVSAFLRIASPNFFTDLLDFGKQPNAGLSTIPIDPEAFMNIEEIIKYHGYPVKSYKVKTADGYILTIQRIPYGKTGQGKKARKPVLVQHCLLCSAAAWVTNVADKNLPYLLADAGYDVWLGNVRGTKYGREHVTLSPESKDFWLYSFDQMAQYDVPAVIDYMLAETGFEQIYYIGHSMGSTIMFALLSTQPKYNAIVKTFFALAPVARLKTIQPSLRVLASFSNQLKFILNLFGSGELLPNTDMMKFITDILCTSKVKSLCSNIIFAICGYNPHQLNSTRLPIHLHYTPAATSVQTLSHFGQLANSGKFQKFDYGEDENLDVYGHYNPPEYDLQRITTKVGLFWGENDLLAPSGDVAWLASQLQNLVMSYHILDPKFSHLDFLWAIDVKPLLYNQLIAAMKTLWQ